MIKNASSIFAKAKLQQLFLASIIFFCPVSFCLAQGAYPIGSADKLQLITRELLRLQVEDPNFESLKSWDGAARKLKYLFESEPGTSSAGEALFLYARLHERRFSKRAIYASARMAISSYQRLVSSYPMHLKTDDALLKLGDLSNRVLRDEAAAKSAYQQILEHHPDGNVIELAKKRLKFHEKEQEVSSGAPSKESYTVSQIGLPKGWLAGKKERQEWKKARKESGNKGQLVLVIDPGHGGEDRGARGVEGSLEKQVVLAVSKRLATLLKQSLGAKTILTRSSDKDISLADRTAIANREKADLFLSIHANASPKKRAYGIETYYLDNTNDSSSLKLAERENSVKGGMGNDLQFIISDLIQTAKMDESVRLAHYLQDAMVNSVTEKYSPVRDLGVKKAPFFVLVGAHMPCVLVEVAFIDHPEEGRRLLTEEYQKTVADSLASGIKKYFTSIGRL